MSNATVVKSRFPAPLQLQQVAEFSGKFLEGFGQVAWFIVVAVGRSRWPSSASARRHFDHRRDRHGNRRPAVAGGTTAIVGFVTLSGGSLIAIQGYASLGNIGVEAFTGFVAALANVRVVAPLVAGFALAATVGAARRPSWAPCASARRSTRSR